MELIIVLRVLLLFGAVQSEGLHNNTNANQDREEYHTCGVF
jgi:hypothetical protein